MELIIFSFFFGVLTVLTPCVLPLLPTILGGTLRDQENSKFRPYIIIFSLSVAIIIFTMLLKGPLALLTNLGFTRLDDWLQLISGLIIVVFGIFTLFPEIWEKISLKLSFSSKSAELMQQASTKKGAWGDVLLGLALGPIFTSCSPTYFLIIGTILPQSFAVGLINLFAYVAGLALTLLAFALLGQKFVAKARWAANPKGTFRKVLGVLFVIIGMAIATGVMKDVEAWLVAQDGFSLINFESSVINNLSR